jgi:protein gp37
MGEASKIEWTDHTFNPWWGCARVSPGCQHCYAESFAKRYGHDVWGKNGARRFFGDKHWSEPVKWNAKAEAEGVRRRVFCASMADVFEDHPALPDQRDRLWDLIGRTPWLDWLLLTKRPENVAAMVPGGHDWPANVWPGTTVEDQERASLRVPVFLGATWGATVRFLSCEPLLGPLDLTASLGWRGARGCLADDPDVRQWGALCGAGIDWVICGGESGRGARPMNPDWARSLRDQCVAAGVPFFFKQWGEYLPEERAGAVVELDRLAPNQSVTAGNGIDTHTLYSRVGKKAAGRELDGRTWDEFPVPAVTP